LLKPHRTYLQEPATANLMTIKPLINTKRGPMELLGYCYMGQTYTVRSLDGCHVSHISVDEVIE
jgi:hypothetical protein